MWPAHYKLEQCKFMWLDVHRSHIAQQPIGRVPKGFYQSWSPSALGSDGTIESVQNDFLDVSPAEKSRNLVKDVVVIHVVHQTDEGVRPVVNERPSSFVRHSRLSMTTHWASGGMTGSRIGCLRVACYRKHPATSSDSGKRDKRPSLLEVWPNSNVARFQHPTQPRQVARA